jgi:hypothetical protein
MKQSSVFTDLGNLFLLIIISIIFNVVLPVLHIYIYLVMIFLSFLFFLLSLLIKNEDIVEASFFTTGSRRYLLPQIKLKLKNKFLEKLLFVYPKVLLFSAWGIVFLLGFAALLAKQIQNL